MTEIRLATHHRQEMLDITAQVQEIVRASGIDQGMVLVQSAHTTLGVTINENADPAVQTDLLAHLSHLVPQSAQFRHVENNSDSHIKVSLVGPSVMLIVAHGTVQLGTWQAIYALEFDGPRSRRVWVQVLGEQP